MKPSLIVVGQKVSQKKKELSRQLRRNMTPEEKILWEELRDRRLGFRFRRQQIIDGFIVDFYCHQAGLVVEIDGGIHKQYQDYDRERDRILNARGIEILRIKNEEITTDLPKVLNRIKTACLNLTSTLR